MKKFLIFCLSALLLALPVKAEAPVAGAASMILIHGPSGRVLASHNADQRLPMASTTKIMTALLALEHCALDDEVEIKAEWTRAEGSSMYLRPGEICTVGDLLHGLMLASGNDAALALAEGCCGSVEAFVAEMNRTAQRIGMVQSSFANPNGLDAENHYSTARDMALLASYAAKNHTFVRFCSTSRVNAAGRSMNNHNRLLREVEGCIGMKTGYTKAAGRTLVSCAEREGRCLVAVTLDAADDWSDHEKLYEWGFGPEG